MCSEEGTRRDECQMDVLSHQLVFMHQLVCKKDGTLRLCVDYRQVNKDTISDRYPMSRVNQLVDAIGRRKGKYFTTLDLIRAITR